jgi:hypothetical protein
MVALVQFGCQLVDSIGFAVAQPLQPLTLEDILGNLPPAVCKRLSPDREQLALKVATKINAIDVL